MEQNNFKRKKNLTNLLSEESQAQILIELSIHRRVSEFHSKVAVQKFFVNIEVLFYVEAFLEAVEVGWTLRHAERYDIKIFLFAARFYKDTQRAVDLFIGCKRWDIIKNYILDRDLVNAEAWDILAKLGKVDVLGYHGRFEELKKMNTPEARAVLKQFKRVDDLIELQAYEELVWLEKGVEYLVDSEKWEMVYFAHEKGMTYHGKSLLNVLLEAHQEDFLYNQKEKEFLLKNKKLRPFIKHRDYEALADNAFYEAVDWEVFLTIMPSKAGKIFEHAVDAENWNFLAKHHKRWLLFKNGQYSLWLNSFFK